MGKIIPDLSKLDNAAKLRKSLYALAFAVGAVLIIHKVVTEEELNAYMLAVQALLGVAFYNVSSSDETPGVE